jgi:hypothetical protein
MPHKVHGSTKKGECVMFEKRVMAIRIYYGLNYTPMADLRMTDGVIEHIQWTDAKARKEFEPMINGYTLIYDEREKREWKDWL